MKKSVFQVAIFALILSGCATRPELTGPEVAMKKTDKKVLLTDDMPLKPLIGGIEQNIEQLQKRGIQGVMQFGPKSITREDYILSLRYMIDVLKSESKDEALAKLNAEFDIHEIYGDREYGEVFMTSYYDPVIPGSLRKTKKFSQALFALPKDLVSIRFGQFLETFPRLQNKMKAPHEQKSDGSVIRGRLVQRDGLVPEIVPFYSREEIDSKKMMSKTGKAIVYVDPVKAFALQIQGSGIVRLKNGREIRVGYAGQNGHRYVAIGRYLLDHIPIEKMSMYAIEQHLYSLPKEEAQAILNKNPSYVFFRKLDTKSITYFGTEVVSGRTIATDYRYFPKGAVGFLEFEAPLFEGKSMEPKAWEKRARLVLDQDTGGAIRGAHRLDLYWGKGFEAERAAGVMRRHGKLYFLTPSETLMEKLRTRGALTKN